MRSALLVAAAITAIATPAVARDGSGYIGIDAGPMLVEDLDINFEDDDSDIDDAFVVDYDRGIDVDLVGGYDWGAFRTEVELGYKRAGIDEIDVGNFINAPGGAEFSADGDASVLSAMLNLLLDVGDDGLSGFVGPGIGLARIDYDADVDDAIVDGNGLGVDARDRVLAWQILAGVRTALSPNIDLGLKYRFFNSGRFEFQEDDGGGVGNPPFELNGKWRSHSLMGSLVYNFAAPPPPPPPPSPPPPPLPPPPPATQTCPDGSVILATDVCPLPPPPPPPPPPEPERG